MTRPLSRTWPRTFTLRGTSAPGHTIADICPWLESGFRVIVFLFKITVWVIGVRVRIITVRWRIRFRVGKDMGQNDVRGGDFKEGVVGGAANVLHSFAVTQGYIATPRQRSLVCNAWWLNAVTAILSRMNNCTVTSNEWNVGYLPPGYMLKRRQLLPPKMLSRTSASDQIPTLDSNPNNNRRRRHHHCHVRIDWSVAVFTNYFIIIIISCSLHLLLFYCTLCTIK